MPATGDVISVNLREFIYFSVEKLFRYSVTRVLREHERDKRTLRAMHSMRNRKRSANLFAESERSIASLGSPPDSRLEFNSHREGGGPPFLAEPRQRPFRRGPRYRRDGERGEGGFLFSGGDYFRERRRSRSSRIRFESGKRPQSRAPDGSMREHERT